MTKQEEVIDSRTGRHGEIRPSLKYDVPGGAEKTFGGSRKFSPKTWVLAVFGVIIIATITAFGLKIIKDGGFNVFYSGKIIIDNSLTNAEKQAIEAAFANQKFSTDVTISANSDTTIDYSGIANSGQLNGLHRDTTILTDIYLPVTGFYNPNYQITSDELNSLYFNSSDFSILPAYEDESVCLTSIHNLSNNVKLLSVDEDYYLTSFISGGIFRTITIAGGNSAEQAQVANSIMSALNIPVTTSDKTDDTTIDQALFPTQQTTLSFAQTGVTALVRRMTTMLDSVEDPQYFNEKIGDYLRSFDLLHTSNEASFSKSASSSNYCASPTMLDVLFGIGLDIVELTGNHNLDCGDEDAITTYNTYQDNNILTVGGGTNADTAAIPLQIEQKTSKFTLLAYNLSTGGATDDDTPGANLYTEEKAAADIADAKDRGEIVIVDIQYYECADYDYTYENTSCDAADSSEGDQIGLFRQLIDLGADIVVGTSAHQPQTYEKYNGGTIYYGLGNLYFDQYYWPGTTRSIVLEHYFYQGKILQTRMRATHYDSNLQPELYDFADTAGLISRWNNSRPATVDNPDDLSQQDLDIAEEEYAEF